MRDIKACLVCFSSNRKLYSLNDALRTEFNTISGLKTSPDDRMPGYLCWECRAFVKKFHLFRGRCHRAHYVLQQLLEKNVMISSACLSSVNRHKLKLVPTIAHMPMVRYVTGDDPNNIKITSDSDKPEPIKKPEYRTLSIQTEVTYNHNEPILKKILTASKPFKHYSEIPSHNNVETPKSSSQIDQPSKDLSNIDKEDFCYPWYMKKDTDTEVFEDMLSYNDDETMEQEYASLTPINSVEAKAAVEVFKFTSKGDHKCSCGIRFRKGGEYNRHFQKHSMFQHGEYRCDICKIYFKTAFLLGCHYKDNHIYKFVCNVCPEVNFTRTSAKRHYIVKHMQCYINYGPFEDFKVVPEINHWPRYDQEPLMKLMKSTPLLPKARNRQQKLPGDYLVYSPISQEDQYRIVEQRKVAKNYLKSSYRCDLCYRGYRLSSTYSRHMAQHDPKVSGQLQCDMCKLYFQNTRKMYKHMISYHLYKYSCKLCDFVCTSKCIALYHYSWHYHVGFECPHCFQKFIKVSSRNTHIRFKHPSNELCNMCGQSFVTANDLIRHQCQSHSQQEIQISEELLTNMDKKSPLYCTACNIQFFNDQAFTNHFSSASRHADTS